MLLSSANRHNQINSHLKKADSCQYYEVFENVEINEINSIYRWFIEKHNRKVERYNVYCRFDFHIDNCLPIIESKILMKNSIYNWYDIVNNIISDFEK